MRFETPDGLVFESALLLSAASRRRPPHRLRVRHARHADERAHRATATNTLSQVK